MKMISIEANLGKDTLVVTPTLGLRDSLCRTVKSVSDIGGSRVQHNLIAPSCQLQFLQSKFPHCTVISEREKAGVYGALNTAMLLNAPNFKYLTYINDDDYWLPNYSELFRALDDNPLAAFAYGKVWISPVTATGWGGTCSPRYRAFADLLAENVVLFTQQATLMRMDLFSKLSGFNEKYSLVADTDFWLRAIKSGCGAQYVNHYCANYSFHEHQLSSNKQVQKFEHQLLAKEHQLTRSIRSRIELLWFRLYNYKNYLHRIVPKH